MLWLRANLGTVIVRSVMFGNLTRWILPQIVGSHLEALFDNWRGRDDGAVFDSPMDFHIARVSYRVLTRPNQSYYFFIFPQMFFSCFALFFAVAQKCLTQWMHFEGKQLWKQVLSIYVALISQQSTLSTYSSRRDSIMATSAPAVDKFLFQIGFCTFLSR